MAHLVGDHPSPPTLSLTPHSPSLLLTHSSLTTMTSNDMVENSNYHQDQQESILVSLIHTVGLVLAVFGNCSVIVIIARTRKLHTPSSILVVVLAVSDLVLSLVWNLVPMMSTLNGQVNRKLRSGASCDVIGFAWQTMLTVSTLFHSIVAFDRYLFIVHPMKYQVYVTAKATSVLITIVLVIASLLSGLLFITGSDFQFLRLVGMCMGSPLWAVLYLLVVFIPSFSLTLFAYQRIWQLCSSIFRQDKMEVSRGQTPRASFSHFPRLSLSTNSQSKPDLCGLSTSIKINSCLDVDHDDDDDAIDSSETEQVETQTQTTSEQHISTIVTTHQTTVTRKNTITTTTIAHDPCDETLTPVEDLHKPQELSRVKKVAKHISQVTAVEKEEKKTSLEHTHTENRIVQSVSLSPVPPVLLEKENKEQNKTKIKQARGKSTASVPLKTGDNKLLRGTSTGDFSISSFVEPACTAIEHIGSSVSLPSTSNTADKHKSNNPKTRSPTVKGSSLTIHEPCATNRILCHQSKCDDIAKKLFGSETVLPSLLYVAILMPLSLRPYQSSHKHRRLRACLLVGLPVLILAVSFLPLPVSFVYMGYAHVFQGASSGVGTVLIKILCHVSYALVPSLTSLFLCLNNKPYRGALSQMFRRCRCVRSRA